MAQRLAELCALLVENTFGDLAAQIFSVLASYGRMHLPALRQLSSIPLPRLKVTLATLIQHHLILYYAAEEDEPTFFQVDWNAAYTLVRSRKFLQIVEGREGETAKGLLTDILHHGHASVGGLAEEYDVQAACKRDSGIDTVEQHMTEHGLLNGIARHDTGCAAQRKKMHASEFHGTLRRLLSEGILLKVNDRTYMPNADLQEEIKETVIEREFPDRKVTGSKKSKLFSAAVNTLKRKYQDEDAYSDAKDIGSHGEIKRFNTSTSNNKRLKLNHLPNGVNGHTDVDDDTHIDKLPNDMIVRVNFDKGAILLRRQRLVRAVDNLLGPATAAVYAALLSAAEKNLQTLRNPLKMRAEQNDDDDDEEGPGDDTEEHEDPLPSVNDLEVDEYLDKTVDIGAGPDRTPPGLASKLPNGVGNHRKKPQHIVDDEDDNNDEDDDNPVDIKLEPHSHLDDDTETDFERSLREQKKRLTLIDMHLHILAEHPKRFCVRSAGSARTTVDFPALARGLIQVDLDAMILARHGQIPHRIVRILRQYHKLDDKQIAAMCMQPVKYIRSVLTRLQYLGIVESQELPKDNGRQPNRAVYLYWFDEDRVRSRWLDITYQGMSRCLQRLRLAREGRFSGIIEKAERVGALGDDGAVVPEQGFQNATDKKEWKKWTDIEETLQVQIERLDDVVAVLRDFSGKDTSLWA